jgi:hypothetical protein
VVNWHFYGERPSIEVDEVASISLAVPITCNVAFCFEILGGERITLSLHHLKRQQLIKQIAESLSFQLAKSDNPKSRLPQQDE